MDKPIQYDVVMSCAGIHFSYYANQRVTLGEDITADIADMLLAAGHIVKVAESKPEPVATPVIERAVVSGMETADIKTSPKPRARKAE